MNQDPYKVLGVSPNASDDEVKNAYRTLARKYHPDNYSADNPLADLATEKMKEINEAYDTVRKMRASGGSSSGGYTGSRSQTSDNGPHRETYNEVRRLINSRRFAAAESRLGTVPEDERSAEWHFLKSMTLWGRGWANDAMRELETACDMDPSNAEYQQAKQMFNQSARGYGSTYYNEGARRGGRVGGCSDADCCTSLCCAQLFCDICGGGCG